jgi:hypothetical protein
MSPVKHGWRGLLLPRHTLRLGVLRIVQKRGRNAETSVIKL